jgi:hypothetical protein
VGDRVACLLSDARAYPRVTGWSDRTLDLSAHGLGVHVQRTFTVGAAPWWADGMLTFALDGEVLIAARV